ncbi:MAG TPA: cyclic pyranopterin monophosphate synthase MoaC [Syntrophothermus lipocalidus]|uniref:Cyclic pyranopterin monophosphate synthase n=1 Tax=Syntrophothermus lipocalidus (strain DSM 12680 / TGB-C1) TaxID=643648 RepID=D7CKW8_SYNLT|nr:cyclic pyranopterin monophosphate synthase MoaC [Syntrophothermus lipocalidus]ADI01353.1 molybdenum cofactor biosynthesis protein C [Syntrophothermus lipocalidus DSM 12680]HHV77405.1 cyclic pyranopterin monophosphate synthase MoaC [Syntrophothermus lipocalidus]
MQLTHINRQGRARMVDVTEKRDTVRVAVAQAMVEMQPETLRLIMTGGVKKGDVLAVAQVAGVMAAKKTPDLIPMCHPLMLTGVDITFSFDEQNSRILITAEVKTTGKTGVEMEALTAAAVAALTVYDMCKAVDRWMIIKEVKLIEKTGGKSGHLVRGIDNNEDG